MKKIWKKHKETIVVIAIGLGVTVYFFSQTRTFQQPEPVQSYVPPKRTLKKSSVKKSDNKTISALKDLDEASLKNLAKKVRNIKKKESKNALIQQKKLQKLIEIEKAKQEMRTIKEKAGVQAFAPEEYTPSPLPNKYSTVNVVQAKHKSKKITLTTLVSEVPLDEDDQLLAAMTLFGTHSDFFEPVEDHGLEHPGIEGLQVLSIEGDYSAYVIQGVSKFTGKPIFYSVDGDGADIQAEISKLKQEFSKLEITKPK
ncbi:MAG: hypothetical protein CME62_13085 [Halobacteriovoraceae bacterium]|nr:hypothetical protein [Halobacteriovoraceae bacterium]|tara:strand:- start:25299 stop:26063 length:765 start_codon:yes stop_codon:yes gene_type:complete